MSGNVGLDLVGTVQHRRTDRTDLLRDPSDLAAWFVAASILDAPPAVTPADLRAATALREAIHRLSTAAGDLGAGAADDLETLNRHAASPQTRIHLGTAGTLTRTGDASAALATVARAAAELLGGPDRRRIKECGGGECTRLFIDTSRGLSRRWCDMLECGNRAKAAGFRARHRH